MWFELLKKAAVCRTEAILASKAGKHDVARRWIVLGKGFVTSARSARAVFMSLDDHPLPG